MTGVLDERITYRKKPVIVSFLPEMTADKNLTEFYFINREDIWHVKGKVDMVISDSFRETEVLLLRKGGLAVVRIPRNRIETKETLITIKWMITHSKKILLRQDDKHIYFVFQTKHRQPRFEQERYFKLVSFLNNPDRNIKPVEDFPRYVLVRRTNPQVEILTREKLMRKYREILTEYNRAIRDLVDNADTEFESLAPPKPGHILQMLAAGLADGQYGNLLICGHTKVIEEKEETEEGETEIIQIPVTEIKALDLNTMTPFSIR